MGLRFAAACATVRARGAVGRQSALSIERLAGARPVVLPLPSRTGGSFSLAALRRDFPLGSESLAKAGEPGLLPFRRQRRWTRPPSHFRRPILGLGVGKMVTCVSPINGFLAARVFSCVRRHFSHVRGDRSRRLAPLSLPFLAQGCWIPRSAGPEPGNLFENWRLSPGVRQKARTRGAASSGPTFGPGPGRLRRLWSRKLLRFGNRAPRAVFR